MTIPQLLELRPYLTERWLRRVRFENRLPSYTGGGRVLFDLNEVDDFVERTRRDAWTPA